MEETKTLVKNVETDNNNIISVKSPLFLIFAEFLGYVSPLIDWATDLCDGKDIGEHKESAIRMDALSILSKMKDEYTNEEIRNYWNEYYDIILKTYDENLNKLETEKFPY